MSTAFRRHLPGAHLGWARADGEAPRGSYGRLYYPWAPTDVSSITGGSGRRSLPGGLSPDVSRP